MGESQGGNKRGIDIIAPSGKGTNERDVCVVHPVSQKKKNDVSKV